MRECSIRKQIAVPPHPGHVLARHPYTSGAAFGISMGRVGYDHRMEVALNEGVDPRVKGVTVDELEEVAHGNVSCMRNNKFDKERGRIRLRHWKTTSHTLVSGDPL